MYYIFIVNNLEVANNYYKTISAEEIINILLENSNWLYNKSTPNLKHIKTGDKVILYLAGEKRRKFIGSFEIAGDVDAINFNGKTEDESDLFSSFTFYTPIQNIQFFDEPIFIKDIKDELDFIKRKNYYGMYLRHSIKAVSQSDYYKITNYISKQEKVSIGKS